MDAYPSPPFCLARDIRSRMETLYFNAPLWVWVLGLLALIGLASAVALYLYKTRDVRTTRRVLRAVGLDYIQDVFLPDGLDGHIHIDYLVQTPGGFLVLDLRAYEGTIFGGERLDNWAHVMGLTTRRFKNPLYDNMLRISSIRELVPNIPVFGRVAFTSKGAFPKGIPEGVSILDQLPEDIAELTGEAIPGPALEDAWRRVKQEAQAAQSV